MSRYFAIWFGFQGNRQGTAASGDSDQRSDMGNAALCKEPRCCADPVADSASSTFANADIPDDLTALSELQGGDTSQPSELYTRADGCDAEMTSPPDGGLACTHEPEVIGIAMQQLGDMLSSSPEPSAPPSASNLSASKFEYGSPSPPATADRDLPAQLWATHLN